MSQDERNRLEELIAAELRKQWLKEEDTYFHGEIYADYRDEMDARTAAEIIHADDPEMAFSDKLSDWYWEVEAEYKCDLRMELLKKLNANAEEFPNGLDDELVAYVESFVDDCVYYDYPADHFLDQMIDVNLMLDTGDGNYDFVLNSVYPCYYGYYNETINDKAGIVWLTRQQGYTKTQLKRALMEGDMSDPHGFLESMRVEVANLPNHMSALTFLVSMSLRDLIRLNAAIRWRDKQAGKPVYDPKDYPYSGYIVLDKKTMCGLFNPWNGGGSVLEVELEKDVRIPIKNIWCALPDGDKTYGYSVGEVYGMCGSAWQDTLKEMHFPKKMTAVA